MHIQWWDAMRRWGHSNPAICKGICLNFVHSQALGMKNCGCKHLCHCLIPDTRATIVELWHHLICMFEVFYFHQLWCHKTAHLKQTQYTSINSAIIPNKIVLTVSLSYSEFCFIQYLVLGLRFLLLIPHSDMFITKVISGKAQVLRIWISHGQLHSIRLVHSWV